MLFKRIFKKRKKLIQIKEYDALTHSQEKLREFETKYGTRSEDVWQKYDQVDIDSSDKCLWRAFIQCFLESGGTFELFRCTGEVFEEPFECAGLKEKKELLQIGEREDRRSDAFASLLSFWRKM